MSLYHLGLHRQFSTPIVKTFSEASNSPIQDVTQDSKDVLVERLNDLVSRLSNTNCLEDHVVANIHREVDKIEALIHRAEKHQRVLSLSDDILANVPAEGKGLWGPLTPAQNMKMGLPNSSQRTSNVYPNISSGEHDISSSRAIEIATAAEHLVSKLSTTVAELELRKEEADHIHDLLLTRVEKATERILLLEYRVAEMEDDFQANQSELKFLRIQLQAIEAQCSQYIPREEDPELSESIMNWKIDWEDIDRRSKKRQNRYSITLNHVSGTSHVVDTS